MKGFFLDDTILKNLIHMTQHYDFSTLKKKIGFNKSTPSKKEKKIQTNLSNKF